MCGNCFNYKNLGFNYCPMCGSKLEDLESDKPTVENIWTYLSSLDTPETYEKWRYAHSLLNSASNDIDINSIDFLNYVKMEVDREFKTMN